MVGVFARKVSTWWMECVKMSARTLWLMDPVESVKYKVASNAQTTLRCAKGALTLYLALRFLACVFVMRNLKHWILMDTVSIAQV